MLHIIEQRVVGKYLEDSLCEDGIFVSDDFVGVIDGATSKGVLDWGGHTSGYFAKETLMEACRHLPAQCWAQNAFQYLNDCLRAASKPHEALLVNSHFERLTASVILFSRFHSQIWSFGDCQCLANGMHFKGEKKIDDLLAEARSFYLQAELAAGKTVTELMTRDTGREMILPFLKMQSQFANRTGPYRYAVLDGFGIDLSDTRVIDVSKGDEIVLASDGYPFLLSTLAESEAALQRLREQDPLCMSLFKSTKGIKIDLDSFDDRAYIRLTVG